MEISKDTLPELRDFYRSQLLDDCIPFWVAHVRDRDVGGYHTCLNRDGSVYDENKLCLWCHGRIVWIFSFLYNELEPNPEWLDLARSGVDFLRRHAFTPEGTMYYSLTRDGKPLEPPRDVFVEMFAAAGFSEFARATADDALYDQARSLFMTVWEKLQSPGRAFQPVIAQTLPVRVHGYSIIPLNVLQELRRFREDPLYDNMIDQCIANVLDFHLRPEKRAVLEVVSWDGETVPGSLGRWINPGHMIEGGIFIIHEGQRRSDRDLIDTGVRLIRWGFDHGWDTDFGGIYNDVDLDGLPVPGVAEAFLYQSKLWWQHAEALYALLLAWSVTDDDAFLDSYRLVHDYTFKNFADPDFGEWFANLDRRGNPTDLSKGNSRKSPFHVPRNLYCCWRLLENITRNPRPADPAQ